MIGGKIRRAVLAMQDGVRAGDLPWDTFAHACQQLLAAADQVDALERCVVPSAVRVVGSDDPGANVVSLDAFRRVPVARPHAPTRGPAA